MQLDRRMVLVLPALMTIAGSTQAAVPADLEYRQGRLLWPGGSARAAVGRAGIAVHKTEGDGATPAGTFPLVRAFFRADRIAAPHCGLPLQALTGRDAWVDDPADPDYNRLVSLPYPAHAEPMWREDAVYDLLVVIGYNMDPVVPGAGSAIFLHIAHPDFSPTAGCIAVQRDVLIGLAPRLAPGSTIAVRL